MLQLFEIYLPLPKNQSFQTEFENVRNAYTSLVVKKCIEKSIPVLSNENKLALNHSTKQVLRTFGRLSLGVSKNSNNCNYFLDRISKQYGMVIEMESRASNKYGDIVPLLRRPALPNNNGEEDEENEGKSVPENNRKIQFVMDKIKCIVKENFEPLKEREISILNLINEKKRNIEILQEKIRDKKLLLDSVGELSQTLENSSISEDCSGITQNDIDELKNVIEVSKEKGRQLKQKVDKILIEDNLKEEDIFDSSVDMMFNDKYEEDELISDKLIGKIVELLQDKIKLLVKEFYKQGTHLASNKAKLKYLKERRNSLEEKNEEFAS
uniref:NAB domain-containing protein n=1 Tax=Parastrongyloides trichosuri TaxID=131310 RepID=A0A0N4ZSR5_PARTI